MDAKRSMAALMAVVFIVFSGCGISSQQSVPPSESDEEQQFYDLTEGSSEDLSQDERSFPPNTPRPDFPPPDSPSENQPAPTGKILQPPPVPSGEALEGLDFSAMEKEELIVLLRPVLERARYFCRFATYIGMEGIEIDYDLDAAILRPFRNDEEYYFHPYTNLPYHTIEDLKEDMCTVFTPDNLEDGVLLHYVLEHLTDDGERIYFASGFGEGLTMERRWELDGLEIVSAGETELTISVPVTWGPYENTVMAPLHFEVASGYIVMDSSYFGASVRDALEYANTLH